MGGYIKRNGNVFLEPEFVWAQGYSEGLASVEKDGQVRLLGSNSVK